MYPYKNYFKNNQWNFFFVTDYFHTSSLNLTSHLKLHMFGFKAHVTLLFLPPRLGD